MKFGAVNFMSEKQKRILQGILDRHTSRKNAMTWGAGESCKCEDCLAVQKVLKK